MFKDCGLLVNLREWFKLLLQDGSDYLGFASKGDSCD